MKLTIRKTLNHTLIERLDVKIFGEDESSEEPPEAVIWLLMTVNDKIAGFAGLSVFKESGKQYGFLERAGILKDFRGHGYQKDLIKARDKEAKRLGLEAVFTYTADYNHASSNSLIKCGYKLYEPYYKYGIKHALYWRKLLGDK